MNNDMKFAVLIDGDNISPKYLKTILDEVADNGVATYKRVYSDWTAKGRDKWIIKPFIPLAAKIMEPMKPMERSVECL